MPLDALQPPASRPLWIPEGLPFHLLPQALQAGLLEIVNPAYQELVLQASTTLEKSAGLSLVHLLWLELVEQHDLGKDMAPLLTRGGSSSAAHQEAIGRHLRLVAAKDKVGKFLLQIRLFREKYGGLDALSGAPL